MEKRTQIEKALGKLLKKKEKKKIKITNEQLATVITNWIGVTLFLLSFITGNGYYLMFSNILFIAFATFWFKVS